MMRYRQPCYHLKAYCPEGCHDEIKYKPQNGGQEILLRLLETWANTGTVPPIYAAVSEITGTDAIDEAMQLSMSYLDDEVDLEGWPYDYDRNRDFGD